MSASIHPISHNAHIISRKALPEMRDYPLPAFDNLNMDFAFKFDTPQPDAPELFKTMMVEWKDGTTIYFDQLGTAAAMFIIEHLNYSAVDVLSEIKSAPEDFQGVYRVID